uniref:Uncharacterized protein n=1 Tax=viral metagenome TaxID=1070528 RepID=A0A6M3IRV0_9ZZZZ
MPEPNNAKHRCPVCHQTSVIIEPEKPSVSDDVKDLYYAACENCQVVFCYRIAYK